jgi:hypothetical protein
MMLRVLFPVALLGGIAADCGFAGEPVSQNCLMSAPPDLRLPARGFSWSEDSDLNGRCDKVPAAAWERKRSGSHDIWVYADLPADAYHLWTITIGVSEAKHAKPSRGVCFSTSTIGWKTLLGFQHRALPWLEDLDHDGNAEVIVWESFPLSEEPTSANMGLVAWVYRLASEDSFTLDWDLSKALARDIAQAYRAPVESTGQPVQPDSWLLLFRAEAATALEQFADGRCRMQQWSPANSSTS